MRHSFGRLGSRVGSWCKLGLIAVAAVAVAGCASRGPYVSVDSLPPMPPPPVREYVIEEGEVLDIRVYNEERLSARTRVRADGKIALTLLGEVEARGKTPSALSRELSQRLQKYLQAPVVVVGVEDVRPLTVTVVGEVTNPGVFTLGKNSGVLQALASAGGFTDFADQDSIFVLRKQPMMRVKFTYRALSHNDVKAVGFALLDGDVVTVE